MEEQVVGPDLVLTTTREDDAVVVAIKGELDAYTAPSLEDQVTRCIGEGVTTIVLDLTDTGFIDSSGLRAILTAQRRLESGTGGLRLRRPSESVSRLLEITGLTEHFVIER